MSEQGEIPQEEAELENFLGTLGDVSPGHADSNKELKPENEKWRYKIK